MQYKKPEYCAMIEDYINSFRNRQGSTPSVRQIASGVGLAVGTVSKYLSYMRENGVLDYDGHRNITTRKSKGLMNMLYVPSSQRRTLRNTSACRKVSSAGASSSSSGPGAIP